MSIVTFFGNVSLNAAAGYGTAGTAGDTGLVGFRFKIFGATDTANIGVRIYTASALGSAWAYLFDASEPANVISVKAVSLGTGWTEVRFTNAVMLTSSTFGYIAAFYLPTGGYSFKAHVFDQSTVDIPSADDPTRLYAIPNNTRGNGVFYSGTQADPLNPIVTTWGSFNAASYAVDTLVFDPSVTGGTALAPTPTVDPVLTGIATTGSTLSCTQGTWIGDLPITYVQQWQRDGTNIGAVGVTYTLTAADEGHTIRCLVTGTNTAGAVGRASNAVTAAAPPVGSEHVAADLLIPVAGAWKRLKVTYEPGLRPEDDKFGAYRNDLNDDSVAINSCIATAVQGALDNGSFYAEVQFSPGVYKLSSPTLKGGAGQGNAQIPLPVVVPENSQKLTLALKGYNSASCMHWAQTQSLKMGTVLRSTLTSQPVDGTWGYPSFIGGPSGQVGTNPLAPWYSNLHLVMDGVSVMLPQNPSFMAVDGRGIAQLTMDDLFVIVNATPTQLFAAAPTDQNGIGVYWPSPGNNAVLDCDHLTVQGYYLGMALAEHFVSDRLLILHANRALYFAGVRTGHAGSTTNHSVSMQYACFEAIQTIVEMDANSSDMIGFSILELDLELTGATQPHIIDAANRLVGDIGWNDYQLTKPRLSGGKNLRIIDRKTARGATALTVPASGAAGAAVWRDRRIHLGGGTVTQVVVDGQTLPDVPRAFDVPSGQAWSVTYTGSPTAVQVTV
jgi:hypothetical protein